MVRPEHATGLALALAGLLASCDEPREAAAPPLLAALSRSKSPGGSSTARRAAMVRDQLEARQIDDPRVLAAMRTVPRHRFVPEPLRSEAYDDKPLPIGHDATISQPYVVALMLELAEVQPGEKVLDVGTGSGYQAAVLDQMGARVFGIEIVPELAKQAARRLAALGYDRVEVRAGDGWKGWPEHAPFDAIVVAAAPPRVPAALKAQLAIGGKLVLPVGPSVWEQSLVVITRTTEGFRQHVVAPVAFVPMTHEP